LYNKFINCESKLRIYLQLTFTIFLFSSSSRSQNLILNPGFENYSYFSNNWDNIYGVIPYWSSFGGAEWYHTNNTVPITGNNCGTPYCGTVPNNMAGRQQPHSGSAYVGFNAYFRNSFSYREMLFAPLTDSLEVGKRYCVSFYTSLADTANYALSLLSALFVKDSAYIFNQNAADWQNWTSYFTPQVTNTSGFLSSKTNWMKVEEDFEADSAYKYMFIGEFTNVVLHDTLYVAGGMANFGNPFAYYYIDDVSVTLLNEPTSAALTDTIIATENTLIQLGNNTNTNANYLWSPALNISDVNNANPTLYVSQSGWYHVQKTQCSYVTYDSVYVQANPVGISEYGTRSNVFSLVPNPNNGEFSLINTLNKTTTGTLFIYDSTGKLIETQVIKDQNSIDVKLKVTNGIYFLRLADASNTSIYLGKILVK
jgi:hypothetical protein